MSKWIEINLPYGPIYTNCTLEEEDSFCERKLNKPGTLIEIEDGSQYLIGHINVVAGVCDDCVEFERDMIVVRYKVVWEK